MIKLFKIIQTGKRNDDENAKEKLYTYVSHVPVNSFKVRFFLSLYCLTLSDDIFLLGPTNCCCGRGVIPLFLPPFMCMSQRNQKNIFIHMVLNCASSGRT